MPSPQHPVVLRNPAVTSCPPGEGGEGFFTLDVKYPQNGWFLYGFRSLHMFTFYWAKYIKIPVCIYNYFKCIRLYKISKTWIQLKVGCWSITLANGGCQQIRIHGISKILHWWLKLTDHTHVFIGTDRSTWNQYGTDCGQNSGNIYGNVANIRGNICIREPWWGFKGPIMA